MDNSERLISSTEIALIEMAVTNAIKLAEEKGSVEEFIRALIYVTCPNPLDKHPVHMLGEALACMERMQR